MTYPAWLWIAVCLFAALAQTVRNSAQRSLSGGNAGMWGATLARFLYGVPFAVIYVALLQAGSGEPLRIPAFSTYYFLWLLPGAAAQAIATAMLLAAMNRGNFVVSVTYSKTEVLQVALLSAIVLHEIPTVLSMTSMVIGVAGVVVLMAARVDWRQALGPRVLFGPAALYGLGSGTCFAFAAIAYRAAGLDLAQASGMSAFTTSGWSVLIAQVFQSAAVMAWMLFTDRGALRTVFSSWRVSMLAGFAGALASFAWFLCYVLRPAADVRALGMIEVVFSYFVSHSLLRERIAPMEQVGLLLVVAAAVGVCLGVR